MSQNAVGSESPDHSALPPPVTAKAGGDVAHTTGVERSPAPAIIAISVGLAGVSRNQPKAALLFVGASIVVTWLYLVVVPKDDERTHSVVGAFFRRLPDILTALGCILIVLGIAFAYPNEIALIPLLAFAFFAALPAFTGMAVMVPRITAVLYGVSLISLVVFVVLVACKS